MLVSFDQYELIRVYNLLAKWTKDEKNIFLVKT